MKERIYTSEISDIKLEANIFDHALFFRSSGPATGLMAEIRCLHEHSSKEYGMSPQKFRESYD